MKRSTIMGVALSAMLVTPAMAERDVAHDALGGAAKGAIIGGIAGDAGAAAGAVGGAVFGDVAEPGRGTTAGEDLVMKHSGWRRSLQGDPKTVQQRRNYKA